MHSGGMSATSTLPSRPRDQHRRRRARRLRRVRWLWRHVVPRAVRRRIRRSLRRLVLVSAAGFLGSAALGALGAGAAAIVGARLGTRRVVVEGRSMVPTFEPGDRLLVLRLPRRWPLRPGDVVALADPREPGLLLVKRVGAVNGDGVTVAGDNAAESTDSRSFGPVDRAEVWGLVSYRYAPRSRAGRVRRGPLSQPART